jgi:hypothetical protein
VAGQIDSRFVAEFFKKTRVLNLVLGCENVSWQVGFQIFIAPILKLFINFTFSFLCHVLGLVFIVIRVILCRFKRRFMVNFNQLRIFADLDFAKLFCM